jgi:exosortase
VNVGFVAMALLVWAPTLWDLGLHWASSRPASHGLYVVMFVAYAAWDRRAALPRAEWHARPTGALVLALAIGLLAVGYADDSITLRALSLPMAGLATIVLACGGSGARALAFPLAYLLLAVPLPASVLTGFSGLTQSLAATAAEQMLTVLHIPVARHGLTLSLAQLDLDITENCDGLPFLFASVVVGIAAAWTVRTGPRQRLAIVALAMITGIIANLLRVAGTAVLASIDPAAAMGTPHQVFGKAVYLAAGAAATVIVIVLVRRSRRGITVASDQRVATVAAAVDLGAMANHPAHHPVPLVRQPGRRGSRVLRVDLPEFEGPQRGPS